MNRERLLQLAAYLDEMPEERFDFEHILTAKPGLPPLPGAPEFATCGYTACGIGSMAEVWPDLFYVDYRKDLRKKGKYSLMLLSHSLPKDHKDNWSFDLTRRHFGLTMKGAEWIFIPHEQIEDDYDVDTDFPIRPICEKSTAKELAHHIRMCCEVADVILINYNLIP